MPSRLRLADWAPFNPKPGSDPIEFHPHAISQLCERKHGANNPNASNGGLRIISKGPFCMGLTISQISPSFNLQAWMAQHGVL